MELKKAIIETLLSSLAAHPGRVHQSDLSELERRAGRMESRADEDAQPVSQPSNMNEDFLHKIRSYERNAEDMKATIAMLSQRVERRNEAIKELHRKLVVQSGSGGGDMDGRFQLRGQSVDPPPTNLTLIEANQDLESQLEMKIAETDNLKNRVTFEHNRFKGQVDKYNQLLFQFNERVRTAEHEKRSSAVIMAAKDRIIERTQAELVNLNEKLFAEKLAHGKISKEKTLLVEQLDEETDQAVKMKGELAGLREQLEQAEKRYTDLDKKYHALAAENVDISKKYSDLWSRLDSPLTTTAAQRPVGNRTGSVVPPVSMASLIATKVEESDESDSDGEGGVRPPIQIKLDAKKKREVTQKPSPNKAGPSSKFVAKSILGQRRKINPPGSSLEGVGSPAASTNKEFDDDSPPSQLLSATRPKSAIGAFARSWAAGGGAEISIHRPITAPRPGHENSIDAESATETDHFPAPVDEIIKKASSMSNGKPNSTNRSTRKRSASPNLSVLQPTVSIPSVAVTDALMQRSESNEPRKAAADEAAAIVTMHQAPRNNTSSVRKGRITLGRKRSISQNLPTGDANAELQGKYEGLQAALTHKEKQLTEEQRFFTMQLVNLKIVNEQLAEQITELRDRISAENREISHERDQLQRTVSYLSDQLCINNSHLEYLNNPTESFDFQSTNFDVISPPRPRGMSRDQLQEAHKLDELRARLNNRTEETGVFSNVPASSPEKDAADIREIAAPVPAQIAESVKSQQAAVPAVVVGNPETGIGAEYFTSLRRRGKIGADEIFLPSFREIPEFVEVFKGDQDPSGISCGEGLHDAVGPSMNVEFIAEVVDRRSVEEHPLARPEYRVLSGGPPVTEREMVAVGVQTENFLTSTIPEAPDGDDFSPYDAFIALGSLCQTVGSQLDPKMNVIERLQLLRRLASEGLEICSLHSKELKDRPHDEGSVSCIKSTGIIFDLLFRVLDSAGVPFSGLWPVDVGVQTIGSLSPSDHYLENRYDRIFGNECLSEESTPEFINREQLIPAFDLREGTFFSSPQTNSFRTITKVDFSKLSVEIESDGANSSDAVSNPIISTLEKKEHTAPADIRPSGSSSSNAYAQSRDTGESPIRHVMVSFPTVEGLGAQESGKYKARCISISDKGTRNMSTRQGPSVHSLSTEISSFSGVGYSKILYGDADVVENGSNFDWSTTSLNETTKNLDADRTGNSAPIEYEYRIPSAPSHSRRTSSFLSPRSAKTSSQRKDSVCVPENAAIIAESVLNSTIEDGLVKKVSFLLKVDNDFFPSRTKDESSSGVYHQLMLDFHKHFGVSAEEESVDCVDKIVLPKKLLSRRISNMYKDNAQPFRPDDPIQIAASARRHSVAANRSRAGV